MRIKLLSNKTINRISAGEVIERPASAVKELVENAIDAGAKKITIRLERAGKNLISIADDGIGMSREDLAVAVQRHATSKLDEEDLLNINSFGFRGEALPSIGAIARLKITSCQENADQAHMIEVNGGEISAVTVAVRSRGTTVEVRDLFFATPARLKFLRTDRTELTAITSVIKRIALGYPNIEFELMHENKVLLHVKPLGNSSEQELYKRVADILGNEFIENSTKVEFASDDISISGYTCLPTFNKATSEEQFLFINRRPVKDKILNIALKVAYQDYMARDRHPITALFLELPTKLVDVNVHPAKTEVRFYDPNSIRSMVVAAIKSALDDTGHRVSNSTSAQAFKYMQKSLSSSNFASDSFVSGNNKEGQSRFVIPGVKERSNFAKEDANKARTDYALAINYNRPAADSLERLGAEVIYKEHQQQIADIANAPPVVYAELHDDEHKRSVTNDCEYPLGAAKTQLHETYIVTQTKDSIVFVDQHAAHERLGYERIKQQITKNGLIKQRMLIPEIVEMVDAQRAQMLADHAEQLNKMGMTIEIFGEKSIIVTEVPSIIGDTNIYRLVQDIADHLQESGENIALTELIEHVTETYACHYAIRAGRKMNAAEMNELLRQMEETPFSGQCNHGRPTYVELKLSDIEKLFGRR